MKEIADFVEAYVSRAVPLRIVEIGSKDVNGSMRPLFAGHDYTGVDVESGKSVDLIMRDPEQIPLPDAAADIVVSANMLEHTRRPWVSMREMVRILKPGGLLYALMPAAGVGYHAYPIDCWRAYAEGMRGLLEDSGLEVLDVHDTNGRDTVGIARKP